MTDERFDNEEVVRITSWRDAQHRTIHETARRLAVEVHESRKRIAALETKLAAITSISPVANYPSNANRNAGWRDAVQLVQGIVEGTPMDTLHVRCDLISGLDYTCAYCDAIDKIKPILGGES